MRTASASERDDGSATTALITPDANQAEEKIATENQPLAIAQAM